MRPILFTLTIAALIFFGGEAAAMYLDSIAIDPNPAYVFDSITITADGDDNYMTNVAYGQDTNSSIYQSNKWVCMSFVPSASGTVSKIITWNSSCTAVTKLRIFDYVNSNATGALLASQQDTTSGDGLECTWEDLSDNFAVTDGTDYWACFFVGHFSGMPNTISGLTDGNTLRVSINEEPIANDASIGGDGTSYAAWVMPLKVFAGDYYPVELSVMLPDGNYSTDYVCRSDYEDTNPSCTVANPCTSACVLKATLFSEESGRSSEVQKTLYLQEEEVGAVSGGVKIYITASDLHTGATGSPDPELYSGFMHDWRSFAATRASGSLGRIIIDDAIQNTCNYDWDCQLALSAGSHTYSVYSAIGGFQYTGIFSTDNNTQLVKIYVPITYNIFEVWTDALEETRVACSDIYSITDDGDVQTSKRISTGLYVDGNYKYWNTANVVPKNCYIDLSVPQLYPFALPGYKTSTEPAVFMYSGANGLVDGELFGWHFLVGDIVGTRSRNGYTNFYSLHTKAEYYPGSGGIFSGRVERQLASTEDGYYSPITTVDNPNMNVDSAIYGDANYNPGDFGLGDTVTCEASLFSNGYVVYDVNFLLITDRNTIHQQASFSPYKKYNGYMLESQPSGAYNMVWHTFTNVDPGHSSYIQCAVQVTNEIGFKSGWAFSPLRLMWATSYSATEGINIFVQYEDGTTSYLGHEGESSGDINHIDFYNFYHAPYYWNYDTGDNPLTLFEGDDVLAQTKDTNTMKTATKLFNIDRGDAFDIILYLARQPEVSAPPVISQTRMYERSAFGDIVCKTNFYDLNLDWTSAVFGFWTSEDGSLENPNCEKTITQAFTTNCNPSYSPCSVIRATDIFMNECGSANDCYVEASFRKRECTSISAGDVTGFCSIYLCDLQGNCIMTQASAQLTVEQYYMNVECWSYALVDGEEDSVIYTSTEDGFIECLLYMDGISSPDQNFTLTFEGKQLSLLRAEYDDYMARDILYYRAEATAEIDALALRNSTDGETWEGDAVVFVTHPTYGNKDATIHLAVIFLGRRYDEDRVYTEASAGQLYDWVEGLALGFMTDPVRTITSRFFDVLLIVLALIIFVPLVLYALYLTVLKEKRQG